MVKTHLLDQVRFSDSGMCTRGSRGDKHLLHMHLYLWSRKTIKVLSLHCAGTDPMNYGESILDMRGVNITCNITVGSLNKIKITHITLLPCVIIIKLCLCISTLPLVHIREKNPIARKHKTRNEMRARKWN